jgi:hypothetical protein
MKNYFYECGNGVTLTERDSMKKTAEQITTKAVVIVSTIMAMVDRFLKLSSTTFIQVWQKTETISRMRKTGNRFAGKIYKLNCLNCVTNYDYENMVNKARSKESMAELRAAMVTAGVPDDKIEDFFKIAKSDITENAETFKSAGLKWGKYVDNSKCVIDHTPDSGAWKDKYGHYLQVCVLNYATPVYKWIDGDKELTEAEVVEMKSFITPAKPSSRQGLKNEKVIRSPRFDTMVSITMNKHNYKLNS